MSDPGYWMYETSGTLRPAVEAYLSGEPMTDEHIAVLRAYFRQWIGSPVWAAEHAWLAAMRTAIDGLTTRVAISRWLDAAAAEGLDPL